MPRIPIEFFATGGSKARVEAEQVAAGLKTIGVDARESAKQAVQAEVDRREALSRTVTALKEQAAQAQKGSKEQAAAADLAAKAERQLAAETRRVSEGNVAVAKTHREAATAVGEHAGRVKDLVKQAAALGFAYFGAQGLIAVGKSSVEAFNEQQLAASRLGAEYGKNAKAVEEWSKGTARSIGLWQGAAEKASADVGRMLEGLGAAPAKAAPMSMTLVDLAQKMALLRQKDPEEVLRAFTAALAGRGIALKRLGIDISTTAIKEEAYRLGMIKTTVSAAAVQQAEEALAIARAKAADVSSKYADNTTQVASANLAVQKAEDAVQKALGGKATALTKAQTMTAAYAIIVGRSKDINKEWSASQDDNAIKSAKLHGEIMQLKEGIGAALYPEVTKIVDVSLKWLSNSKNLTTVQHDVKVAVDDVTSVVKTAYTWANHIADAVGGWSNALKILIGLKVAGWISGLIGPIAGLIGGPGTGLKGATGAAGGLLGKLGSLAKIGGIAIGIELFLKGQSSGGVLGLLEGLTGSALAGYMVAGPYGAVAAGGLYAGYKLGQQIMSWLGGSGSPTSGGTPQSPSAIAGQSGPIHVGTTKGQKKLTQKVSLVSDPTKTEGPNLKVPDGAIVEYDPNTQEWILSAPGTYFQDVAISEAQAAKLLGVTITWLRAKVREATAQRKREVKREQTATYKSSAAAAQAAGRGSVAGTVFAYAQANRFTSRGGSGVTPQSGFDCSGYVVAAYRAAGITLVHSSQGMYAYRDGEGVPGGFIQYVDASLSAMQPGDVILWNNLQGGSQPDHVGIYAGGGMAWSYSQNSGQPSHQSPWNVYPVMRVFRVVKVKGSGGGGTQQHQTTTNTPPPGPDPNLVVGHTPHKAKTHKAAAVHIPTLTAAQQRQLDDAGVLRSKGDEDSLRAAIRKLVDLSDIIKSEADKATGKRKRELEHAYAQIEKEINSATNTLNRMLIRDAVNEQKALDQWEKRKEKMFSDSLKQWAAYVKKQSDIIAKQIVGTVTSILKGADAGYQKVTTDFGNVGSGTIYKPGTVNVPGVGVIPIRVRSDATLADWMNLRDEIAQEIGSLQKTRVLLVRQLKRVRRAKMLTAAKKQELATGLITQISDIDQKIIDLGQDYADVIYTIGEMLDAANQAAAAKTPEGQPSPTLTYDIATGKLYLNGQEITAAQGAAQITADNTDPSKPTVQTTGSLFDSGSQGDNNTPTPGTTPGSPDGGSGNTDRNYGRLPEGGGGGQYERYGPGDPGSPPPPSPGGPGSPTTTYTGPGQWTGTMQPGTGAGAPTPGSPQGWARLPFPVDIVSTAPGSSVSGLLGGIGPGPLSLTSAVPYSRSGGTEEVNMTAFNYWRMKEASRKAGVRSTRQIALDLLADPASLPTPWATAGVAWLTAIQEGLGALGGNDEIKKRIDTMLSWVNQNAGTNMRMPLKFGGGGWAPGSDTGTDYVPARVRGGELMLTPPQQRRLAALLGIGQQGQPTGVTGGPGGGIVMVVQPVFNGAVLSAPEAMEAFARQFKPYLDQKVLQMVTPRP